MLNHFVGSCLMMATVGSGGTMGGEATDGTAAVAAMGDLIGDDPSAAYAAASEKAQQAFTAPGALDRVWNLPFGSVPGAVALNIHLMETLAHTWDLAKVTGQLDKLDPELADLADPIARGLVQPVYRNDAGNPFAAEVPVPSGAGAYDRFAGFLGRVP